VAAGRPRNNAFELRDLKGTVYWSKLEGKGFPTLQSAVRALRKGGFLEKKNTPSKSAPSTPPTANKPATGSDVVATGVETQA